MRKSALIGLVAVAGLAAAANAQTVTYSWSVVSGSTSLNPGESVTLALSASRDMGDFYAGGKFNIRIDGLDATDGVGGGGAAGDTDAAYGGRRPGGANSGYRNFPSGPMALTLNGNVLEGTGAGGSIDHATIPPILGGNPDLANPTEFFRFTFTAGTVAGTRSIVTQFTDAQIAVNGIPSAASFVDGAIDINVVPAPASMALLGLGGLVAGRRRR